MLSDVSMNEINNIQNRNNEILDFFNNIPIPPIWTDDLVPLTLPHPTATQPQLSNRLENMFLMN